MLEKLFNNTNIAAKALDATWLRNDAIAQNIANVDTPGYKRKTVKFEEYLSGALDNNSSNANLTDKVNNIPIEVTEDNTSLSTRLDGNNVDIESEMASMAKNTIQYNTLVQRINAQFKNLQSAIKEGR